VNIHRHVSQASSSSACAQAVAVVQRAMRQAQPAEVMEELGFGLLHLVASFPVSMSGEPPAVYLHSADLGGFDPVGMCCKCLDPPLTSHTVPTPVASLPVCTSATALGTSKLALQPC